VKTTLETGSAAPTVENKNKVDAPFRNDSRVTSKLCAAVWFENPAFMVIIGELGYRNICAR
jgi:hypothetical protein